MKEVFSSQGCEENIKYTICEYKRLRRNFAFIMQILQ